MGFPGAAKSKGVPCPGKGGVDAPAALIRALTWQDIGTSSVLKSQMPIAMPLRDCRAPVPRLPKRALAPLWWRRVSRGTDILLGAYIREEHVGGMRSHVPQGRGRRRLTADSRLTRRDQGKRRAAPWHQGIRQSKPSKARSRSRISTPAPSRRSL